MKKLLEKCEHDLDIQKVKVKALEAIIIELGGELPKDEQIALMNQKEKEEEQRLLEEEEQMKEVIVEEEQNLQNSVILEEEEKKDSFINNELL